MRKQSQNCLKPRKNNLIIFFFSILKNLRKCSCTAVTANSSITAKIIEVIVLSANNDNYYCSKRLIAALAKNYNFKLIEFYGLKFELYLQIDLLYQLLILYFGLHLLYLCYTNLHKEYLHLFLQVSRYLGKYTKRRF